MRRVAPIAAATAVAVFASVTEAAVSGTLGVSPNKAGKGTTATLDISPPKADQNPRSIVVRVVKGVKVDPLAVAANCTPQQANANKCPADSRIGGGKLDVTVTSASKPPLFPASKATVRIDLFLAPPPQSGDTAGVVSHFKVSQTGQQGHVTGRITRIHTGGFGYQTSFDNLDTALPPPTGFKAHLDHMHLTFGAHRKVTKKVNGKHKKVRHDLIKNPAKCTGSWAYNITIGYRTSDKVPTQGSVACTK